MKMDILSIVFVFGFIIFLGIFAFKIFLYRFNRCLTKNGEVILGIKLSKAYELLRVFGFVAIYTVIIQSFFKELLGKFVGGIFTFTYVMIWVALLMWKGNDFFKSLERREKHDKGKKNQKHHP